MPQKADTRTYMEDANEEGEILDDSKTYVSAAAPSLKEEANVSRTRGAKDRLKRRDSASPTTMHTDSDSTAHPSSPLRRESSRTQRLREKPREKTREKRLSAPPAARPTMKGSKTMPTIQTASSARRHQQEDPSWYGISPNAPPAPIAVAASTHSRSRSYTVNPNQRQNSYYAPSASKPPLANAKYWPPPPSALGTSFPPQAPPPFHPFPSPSPYHSPYPPPPPQAMQPPPPPSDYFTPASRDPRDILMARFDANRPRSAMARHFPPPPAIGYGNEYDDDFEDGGVALERRSSLRRRSSRREEDRVRMPPPPRPSTSRPMSTGGPFAPPPISRSNRHSIGSVGSFGYDDDSMDDESSYQDASPPGAYDYHPYPVRRPSVGSPSVYEGGPRSFEMTSHQGRRNSQYGVRNRSTERGMEDQMRIARQYQNAVDGPTEPLTLDSLRKINKTPSRGTKSTGSREENGYGLRSAATTRTSVEEDITILVKGSASLNIGNASLNVTDGTEIRINGDRESRGGSDDASTAYEERGPKYERPVVRNRAASRTASRSRGQSFHGQHPFQPQHDYGVAHHHYHEQPMSMPYAPPSGYTYPTQF